MYGYACVHVLQHAHMEVRIQLAGAGSLRPRIAGSLRFLDSAEVTVTH